MLPWAVVHSIRVHRKQPTWKPETVTTTRRISWTLLACAALTACGAAGDAALQLRPSELPSAGRAIDDEGSGALGLDGDYRTSEPLRRLARQNVDNLLHPLVMPLGRARHPLLASRATGSVSVGTVTGGYLVNAAELPLEGPYHRVLVAAADRQTRFATDEMRDLLLCAAQGVAKNYPGHKLHLGNLSRMSGGTLPWSVSHHNGRDADVAFYVRTPSGRIASPERLYHFNARLEATDSLEPLRFDVAANWTFVKGLTTCRGTAIQHLFVANWLRAPLLEYAKKHNERPEVIAQVAEILAQPHNALPHNDHLHLRIGCSADDNSEGCLDAARAPLEAVGLAPGVRARLPRIREALRSGDAATRADALLLVGAYRDALSLPALLDGVRDPDVRVRRNALEVLGQWRPAGTVAALAGAVEKETDPQAVVLALQALAQMGETTIVEAHFDDPRVLTPPQGSFGTPTVVVRRLALELLRDTGSLEVARAAVPLLSDPLAEVRDAARSTLTHIVNYTTQDVMAALGGEALASAAAVALVPENEQTAWRTFLDRLPPDASREFVALQGLRQQGLGVEALDRNALPELVRALRLPPPYRDNAAQWIERVVQFKPPVGRGARSNPTDFWPDWLVHKRFLTPSALASLTPAGGSALAADSD